MTWCQVNGYPADKLDEALDGVKVVVIPAGVPRKVWLYLPIKRVWLLTPSHLSPA